MKAVIRDLINEIKECTNKKEQTKLISKLKRQYNMNRQEDQKKGSVRKKDLVQMIEELLSNYEELKYQEGINEILETIAEDYEDLSGETEKEEEYILKVYAKILGNPGADAQDYKPEYIEKVIREKIIDDVENGVNRDDIINVLKQQSNSMYDDVEKYQELINNVLIPVIDEGEQKIENPKILEVLSDLAKSYKMQADYEKVQETYEKGIKLTNLSDTVEYEELTKEYEEIREYINEINKNFNITRFDSLENFMKSLEMETLDTDFFTKLKEKELRQKRNKENSTSSDNRYKMSVEDKLKGMGKLLEHLKEKNPKIEIKKAYLGKELYESYIIFPIDYINIAIMEKFDDEKNDGMFIMKSEKIGEVIKLGKNKAKKLDGVEPANHTKDFNSYVKRLIKKVEILLDDEKITDIQEGTRIEEDDGLDFLNKDDKITATEKDTKIEEGNEYIILDGLEELLKNGKTTDTKEDAKIEKDDGLDFLDKDKNSTDYKNLLDDGLDILDKIKDPAEPKDPLDDGLDFLDKDKKETDIKETDTQTTGDDTLSLEVLKEIANDTEFLSKGKTINDEEFKNLSLDEILAKSREEEAELEKIEEQSKLLDDEIEQIDQSITEEQERQKLIQKILEQRRKYQEAQKAYQEKKNLYNAKKEELNNLKSTRNNDLENS